MAVKKTSASALKVLNPAYIYATPYTSETEKGSTTYSFEEVLRDSTSLTQDDPTTNTIENELSSTPIDETVQLGSYQFTTTVCDMQTDILKDFLGFSVDEVSGNAYAPNTYAPVYAEITLVFKKGSDAYSAIVLPKVKLNSKISAESLSSSMAQVILAGTAYATEIEDGENSYTSPTIVKKNFSLPS